MSYSSSSSPSAGVKVTGGLLVAFVVFVIWFLSVMTVASVPPDKVMLHYTGGPFQGIHFVSVVQPGTSTHFYGLMETTYELPATQQSYTISKNPKDGSKAGEDSVVGVSSDNVSFTFEAATYFKLNTDSKVIQTFMEQICLHDHCTSSSGWKAMIDTYFRPIIDNAVRLEAGKYTRDQLYSDPNTLKTMQADIGAVLGKDINTNIGGDFFCGPDSTSKTCTPLTFVLKNPTPPTNVVSAYNDTAAAKQEQVTATNNAVAKVTAADADRDAQNARAQASALTQAQIDYLKAQAMAACAANSNCTLVITDADSGVNVNVGTASSTPGS